MVARHRYRRNVVEARGTRLPGLQGVRKSVLINDTARRVEERAARGMERSGNNDVWHQSPPAMRPEAVAGSARARPAPIA